MVNDVGDVRLGVATIGTIRYGTCFLFFNYSSESVDRLFARFFQAARLLIFNEANGKEHFACDREPIDNRVISLLSLSLLLTLSLSLVALQLRFGGHFLSSQIFGNKSSISFIGTVLFAL